MANFENNLFIYGSFAFLKKGLGFAFSGSEISDEQKREIDLLIEQIGNYPYNSATAKQYLFCKLSKSNRFLILTFSFGGIDEFGRKTFISKGLVLSDAEFKYFDFNPFFFIQSLSIDFETLKTEIQNPNKISLYVDKNYDLRNISKVLEANNEELKKVILAVWESSKIRLPFNVTYFGYMKILFSITPIKDRVNFSFITCLSRLSEQMQIVLSDKIDTFYSPDSTPGKKNEEKFSLITRILKEDDREEFQDFILSKKKPSKLRLFIKKFLKI